MRFIISGILGLFFITLANAAEFTIKSSAFSENGKIPALYTCDGKNISPALSWSNTPAKTQSYALILSSPDWTVGNVYLWILYNIPKNINRLAEKANRDLPPGVLTGTNYYNETYYSGPCPPDTLLHHYDFTLYALDTVLDLSAGASSDEVFNKMENHIIKETKITGIFSHQ